ncbi:hypothetical protein [Allocoleopsis franciscana]|uniref:hypothetical protein n=1 Tax=Allocoleopsis franciscana TaxID=2886352 RepID=UPI0002F0BAA8
MQTLTEASDLYSLGATLICLLTGTRSQDIGNLIDPNYCFNVKKLLPQRGNLSIPPSLLSAGQRPATPSHHTPPSS